MNFNKMIFYNLLYLSLMIGMFSSSMLFFWMSVEINMMSFIPIILFNMKYYNDGIMKYFLIQSFSSSLMLFVGLSLYYMMEVLNLYFFMIFTMLFKLGYFPFHQWYLNLLKNMDWISILYLMTLQKFLPFVFLKYVFSMFKYSKEYIFLMSNIYIMVLFMCMIIMMLIYSNNSIKLFIGFSSLHHMSWMVLLMFLNFKLWFGYFMIYSMILGNLLLILDSYKINYFNHLYMIKSKFYKFLIFFLVLLLMMMPPFIGFFLKLFSIYLFANKKILFISYILLIMSTYMSYYYFTLFLPSLMFNHMCMFNNNYITIKYLSNFIIYLILFNMFMIFLMWFMII